MSIINPSANQPKRASVRFVRRSREPWASAGKRRPSVLRLINNPLERAYNRGVKSS
jgi:hypothetical protein